jgi:hypothetical protein
MSSPEVHHGNTSVHDRYSRPNLSSTDKIVHKGIANRLELWSHHPVYIESHGPPVIVDTAKEAPL